MRRPIQIANKYFASKDALRIYIRAIVARSFDGIHLNEEDTIFFTKLLERHPEHEEKIGAGIASFVFRKNPVYQFTLTIYIVHPDKTETDFSWRTCIDGKEKSLKSKIVMALRQGIRPQLADFRNKEFDGGKPFCAISNIPLERNTCEVDHIAPITFDTLYKQWLTSEGLALEELPINELKYTYELKDLEQLRSWRSYHHRHAKLRLLTVEAHREVNRGAV